MVSLSSMNLIKQDSSNKVAGISQQITNKPLLIGFCHRFGDKVRDQVQVGSTSPQVKQRVNLHTLVGGGCKEPRLGTGTHKGGQKTTTKWWWWNCGAADAAGVFPAAHFGWLWGPQIKSQK